MLKFPSPSSAPLPPRLKASEAHAAKASKRWNEAAEIMLQLAVERAEFNESDCKLLSEAHREIISPLMVAWNGAKMRAADTTPDESAIGHREALRLSKEINVIAERLITAASNQLSIARSPECRVLLWSSKGDALMWQLRISPPDRAVAFQSLASGAHLMAYDEAEAKLAAAAPSRLMAALRLAHFYAEKTLLLHKAIEISSRAIECGQSQMNQLDQNDYRTSKQLLEQLSDAKAKWTKSAVVTLCDTTPSPPGNLIHSLSNLSTSPVGSSSASASASSSPSLQSKKEKELKKELKKEEKKEEESRKKAQKLLKKEKKTEKVIHHRITFENSFRVIVLDDEEEFHYRAATPLSTCGDLINFLENLPRFQNKKIVAFSSKVRKISSLDAEIRSVAYITTESVNNSTPPLVPFATPLQYPGVVLESVVARSGQAVIYRAQYKGEVVAAKVFDSDVFHGNFSEFYRTELESLLRLRHPNVLRLVTCFEVPQPCVLTPLMAEGDLCGYLRRNGPTTSADLILRFAKGIAKGLEYIHSERLIHRDLKSPNIFLHRDLEAVIGDFGLAHRTLRTLTVARNREGTLYWMAPELFGSGVVNFSNKIDVYAFGIILWEIHSGSLPYQEIPDVESHVRSGGRPIVASSTTWDVKFVQMMQKCWDGDARARPTMGEVVKAMESSPWRLFHVK